MKNVKVVPAGSTAFDAIENPGKEFKKIKEVAGLTVQLQDQRYVKPKRILRGVHPKAHGCVKARFKVLPLREDLRVGLFAEPKEYEALVRYSNAATRVGPDTDAKGRHDSRGMAVKVFDVGTHTLLPDAGRVNQDFLMINQPSFAFANLDDYLKLNRVLAEDKDVADRFFAPLAYFQKHNALPEGVSQEEFARIAASFKEVQKLQAQITANPVEVQYFSAAPFLFGKDRVMKFSVRPAGGLRDQKLPPQTSPDYLREALKETLAAGKDLHLNFMVQVRERVPEVELENATTVWEEGEFPFATVAEITIPAPQPEAYTAAGEEECEQLVFNPWHSLPDHQPVGSINRLRRAVYIESAQHRGAGAKQGNKPAALREAQR